MIYVYAMYSDKIGEMKIGKSKAPERRRRDLERATRLSLRTIWSMPESDLVSEKVLHDVFSSKRVYGEWFKVLPCEFLEVVNDPITIRSRIPKPKQKTPGTPGRPRLFSEPTQQVCMSLPKSIIEKLNDLCSSAADRSRVVARLIEQQPE